MLKVHENVVSKFWKLSFLSNSWERFLPIKSRQAHLRFVHLLQRSVGSQENKSTRFVDIENNVSDSLQRRLKKLTSWLRTHRLEDIVRARQFKTDNVLQIRRKREWDIPETEKNGTDGLLENRLKLGNTIHVHH